MFSLITLLNGCTDQILTVCLNETVSRPTRDYFIQQRMDLKFAIVLQILIVFQQAGPSYNVIRDWIRGV